MKRYLSVLVLFASSIGSVYAAAPPVIGLRADLYSSTAAELFWNRVPNQTLRYEVMRDDGPIGFTDGTSYSDPGRIPGQSNTYSVTAIDAEGTRSETAQIMLASFGQCDFAVTGLRADVYSDTAAELFWIRTPGRAVTYEIVRDDGMSWQSHVMAINWHELSGRLSHTRAGEYVFGHCHQ